MRIRYTLRAGADLEAITAYYRKRNPAVGSAVLATIERRIAWLSEFPLMAPGTDEPGVRELPIVRYPYKVYYEVVEEEERGRLSVLFSSTLGFPHASTPISCCI